MKFIKTYKVFESNNEDEKVALIEDFFNIQYLEYMYDKVEIFLKDNTNCTLDKIQLNAVNMEDQEIEWLMEIKESKIDIVGAPEINSIIKSGVYKPVIELYIEPNIDAEELPTELKETIENGLNGILNEFGFTTGIEFDNIYPSLENYYEYVSNIWYLPFFKIESLKESNVPSLPNTLIIVDVQKSFRKFFTEMYVNQLTKHCNNFQNVYLIWDNHIDGKNIDKDFLYDKKPDVPVHNDFYNFPNIKDRIEKRYNYNVNIDFYKKILDKTTYQEIKEKESKKQLKRGSWFKTKEGTILVYIGNNHKWFHVPKKLYDIFKKLKGQTVEIVGGSDSECLADIIISAETIGVTIKRNYKYIWSASHCPIK